MSTNITVFVDGKTYQGKKRSMTMRNYQQAQNSASLAIFGWYLSMSFCVLILIIHGWEHLQEYLFSYTIFFSLLVLSHMYCTLSLLINTSIEETIEIKKLKK